MTVIKRAHLTSDKNKPTRFSKEKTLPSSPLPCELKLRKKWLLQKTQKSIKYYFSSFTFSRHACAKQRWPNPPRTHPDLSHTLSESKHPSQNPRIRFWVRTCRTQHAPVLHRLNHFLAEVPQCLEWLC